MIQTRFYGVRGSYSTPDARMLGYGGHTACIVLAVEDGPRVIIDAGSGLTRVPIGSETVHHIFLTHFHRDHIDGIPFFKPLFDPSHKVVFHAAAELGSIRDTLSGILNKPYSPITFDTFRAHIDFDEFQTCTRVGAFTVHTFELHHPQRAFGYRVDHDDYAVVHASDHEHGNSLADAALQAHSADADVLIYDSHYTPEEYQQHSGWGHSHWLEGVRMAQRAQVGRLILFHHSPTRTDAQVNGIADEACKHFDATEAAREEPIV